MIEIILLDRITSNWRLNLATKTWQNFAADHKRARCFRERGLSCQTISAVLDGYGLHEWYT